jgi:hypothetical protein
MGSKAPSDKQSVSYFQITGEPTIYVSQDSIQEEFDKKISSYRNRKVVAVDWQDIREISVILEADVKSDLAGEAVVKFRAEQWVWDDGVPVPGSTPKRVAQELARISAVDFLGPEVKKEYGFSAPKATIDLSMSDDKEVTILMGALGQSEVDEQGREFHRRYMRITGDTEVYLIQEHSISVLLDLIRETNRKKLADKDKEERQERINRSLEKK